jgi:hypothetical protein
MEPLSQKVSTLLRKRFGRGARVNLKDEDGIIGTVTSARFRDVETIDRVNMIWEILEPSLTMEEQRNIAIIIPMTPEESQGNED